MQDKINAIVENMLPTAKGKRVVVGIDGLSRSGKTTMVKKLEASLLERGLSVKVLHIDDYIVERNRRYHTGYEEWYEYYHLQWDVQALQEKLFKKLKNATEIQLPTYNSQSDTQQIEIISLLHTDLIIMEGVFLQRIEWRDFFDFILYLDCPKEIRFSRERKETQLNLDKFKNRYWKAEDYYIEKECPKKRANIVFHV
ncbi:MULTISPECIES: kinase [Bacillaceae]|uniref:Kinase n=1 Tax=Niallia hominis TaxID=3133173 RepID=A0ABV1EVV4_9BACI|nr:MULTISPECIES: kinase [Bacillaceae]MCF2650760.1 AAA family ATPase [Niallia circulans]CAI9396757.1 Uridine kinase [Bacillus sp. T2.9-1]